MTQPALEVVGVGKRFGDQVALADIDLTVTEGEFISILGPSGCGKTTLLRIVSGFEQPTTGRIRIHGDDVTTVSPHRRPTNIVFQRGALFPHMNVFDNVGYSLRLKRWPKARIVQRVQEMLSLVRLEGLAHRGPTELSGGQIQRVALARALAPEPRVLLLDEPLSALDLKLRQHMQLELRSIQRQLEATFVYVTHDQTEALVMSDRIAIMNEGRIVQLGSPREIYTQPASVFASDFIGETNLVRGTIAMVSDGLATVLVAERWQIRSRCPQPLSAGTAATVSIRPEAIRVVPRAPSEPAARGLPALVTEIIYLGNRVRIEAELEDGEILLADIRDDEAEVLERGQCVDLSWASNAATVWAGAETQSD